MDGMGKEVGPITFAMRNLGSLTDKIIQLLDTLTRRIDIACLHKTMCTGKG